MVDVLLINPPLARYDVAELAPPLGLLTLAASLRAAGQEAVILDLNLPDHREAADYPASYLDYITDHVARFSPREIGITSMGVNTHLSLNLATQLAREITPDVKIGGVHVSTVAASLQSELTAGVRIAPERNAPIGSEWWNSPIPNHSAEELFCLDVNPYFQGNSRRLANLEASVGCKYRCAFCYSPSTFGYWENQQIDQVVQDFLTLGYLGFEHAFLVGDNIVNDRSWFLQLAKSLLASGSRLTWNGYATLPDLNEEIIEHAALSGCSNLYIGIDAVEGEQQKLWKKRFLRDNDHVFSLLHAAHSVRLQLTFAFILDIDPKFDQKTAMTLEFAAQAARYGADIRISVITPYPRTPLFTLMAEVEYSEDKAAILMDLPQVVVTNNWAERYPALFPWHSRPRKITEFAWRERLLAVHAAQVLLNAEPPVTVSGHAFWSHCLTVAKAVAEMDHLHKTELKSVARRLSAHLCAA